MIPYTQSSRGNRARFSCSCSDEHEPRTRTTTKTRLTPHASRLLLLLLALTTLGAAPVEKKPKATKIAVSTHLDKTAVWVGDLFRYTVRAIHDPDIEIVLEPLKKESLNLAPFVVREVTVRHSAFGGNKKVTEVILLLTTYEGGQAELRIPSFVLYYFTLKAGSEKGGDTLAESFPVPATRVGLRSTLTADALRPRDSRVISRAGPERWVAALSLGLAGMIFLAVQFTRRLWTSLVHGKTQNTTLDPAGQGPNGAGLLARYSIDGPGFRRRSAAVLCRSLPVHARVSRSIAGNRCLKPDSR